MFIRDKNIGVKGGVCGIYKISCPSGSFYIGSSRDIRRRWYTHRCLLKKGKFPDLPLTRAYSKHGGDIEFTILEECEPHKLLERELFYIENLRPDLNIVTDPTSPINNSSPSRKATMLGNLKERAHIKAVVCSNGMRFESGKAAAEFAGVDRPRMSWLIKTQAETPKGIRFRLETDSWLAVDPYEVVKQRQYAKMIKTRAAKGIAYPSDATKQKMSISQAARRSAQIARGMAKYGQRKAG